MPADLLKHEYYAIHNDTFFPRDKWLLPNGHATVCAIFQLMLTSSNKVLTSIPITSGYVFRMPAVILLTIQVHGPYVGELVKELAYARSASIKGSQL